MKALFSKVRNNRRVQRLSSALNRNTGWLIAVAIVYFGFYNVGVSKENQILIKNSETSAKAAQRAAVDSKEAAQTAKRVIEQQLKEEQRDNIRTDNQTLVLCRLIIRKNFTVQLTPEEEDEIEGICEEEIAEGSVVPSAEPSSPGPSSAAPGNGSSQPTPIAVAPPPPPQPISVEQDTPDEPVAPPPPNSPPPEPEQPTPPTAASIVQWLLQPVFSLLELIGGRR